MVALVFFTNPFVIRKCIGLYEAKEVPLNSLPKYNAGILLGGMVSYNQHEDKGYFNPAADRFIQTALLFKKGHINKVIVAAGNGYITKNNFREALFIKERLIQIGIPAEEIYTDTSSRNTLENARFSKKIIDSFHIPGPYLLISSAMHLPRAEKVFKKAGLNTDLYPCDFVAKRTSNNFFEDYMLPSSYALPQWDAFIKEWVGIITYKLTGNG
ncbi:MAG: YdcF family protein [Flavisolibacter sp.]